MNFLYGNLFLKVCFLENLTCDRQEMHLSIIKHILTLLYVCLVYKNGKIQNSKRKKRKINHNYFFVDSFCFYLNDVILIILLFT